MTKTLLLLTLAVMILSVTGYAQSLYAPIQSYSSPIFGGGYSTTTFAGRSVYQSYTIPSFGGGYNTMTYGPRGYTSQTYALPSFGGGYNSTTFITPSYSLPTLTLPALPTVPPVYSTPWRR